VVLEVWGKKNKGTRVKGRGKKNAQGYIRLCKKPDKGPSPNGVRGGIRPLEVKKGKKKKGMSGGKGKGLSEERLVL